MDSLFGAGKHIPIASFLKLSKQEMLDWLSVRLVFEAEACRLAAGRITDEELAALLGSSVAEIAQLKNEIRKLKAERDILKKAAAYFAKDAT